MTRGKQTCKILKEIRREIARANDIEFVTSECHYRGECRGTCPKCEAEVRYLEQQLERRRRAGKAATVVGVSMGITSLLAAGTMTACRDGAKPANRIEIAETETAGSEENGLRLEGKALEGEAPSCPTEEGPGKEDSAEGKEVEEVALTFGEAELVELDGDVAEIIDIAPEEETIEDSLPAPKRKTEIPVVGEIPQEEMNAIPSETDFSELEKEDDIEVVLQGIVTDDTPLKPDQTEVDTSAPYLVAETMPRFGDSGTLQDFKEWADTRAAAFGGEGRVILSFVVDTVGKVCDINIFQSPDKALSDEAIRIVASSPAWQPATEQGRPVRLRYTMPIDFRRREPSDRP